jgi:hypothetical protein
MFDDDPSDPLTRKPRQSDPLPPPPGFSSWGAWAAAGFPMLDLVDEPEDLEPAVQSPEEPGPVKLKRRRRREAGQLGLDFMPAEVPRRPRRTAPR